jgi:hypothetical protein
MPRRNEGDEVRDVLDRAKSGPPKGYTSVSFGPALGNEGDVVEGIYLGPGKPWKGKKGKMIPTYMIKTEPGGDVRILGAVQIDQFMVTVKPGWGVWIRRGKQIKGGKGRVTLYDFAVRKK